MDTTKRNIKEWMQHIENGQILLPRFQRDEVWPPRLVEKFLEAILDKKPLGVFLVLQVNASDLPFEPRPLEGAPEERSKCTEQLLDGQQRLTALWRTFKDNYEKHTFYVEFEKTGKRFEVERIEAVSKKGKLKSIIGNPEKEFGKNMIPLRILSPGEKGLRKYKEWIKGLDLDSEKELNLETFGDEIRENFGQQIIPFFLLPPDISEEDAINIFIDTNTSSVKLTHFDIAVAQMEREAGESLKEKTNDIKNEIQGIEGLDADVGDLVLKVYCVMSGKVPTYGQYKKLDFENLSKEEEWQKIVDGIKWTVNLLGNLGIRTEKRLPTAVPLRVLPALHQHVPKKGEEHARALRIVKKYLWWAFLSDRYEKWANQHLKEDYDDLRGYIQEKTKEEDIRIFKSKKPDEETVKSEGWPSRKKIASRGILTVCSLGGAKDIASNRSLTESNKREFHHIFPKAVLQEFGIEFDLALNCMLLEPPTNKDWTDLLPGDFLWKAIEKSGCRKPEEEIKKRLKTHLLNHECLLQVKETEIDRKDKNAVEKTFQKFLDSRAEEVMNRIEKLLDEGDWK